MQNATVRKDGFARSAMNKTQARNFQQNFCATKLQHLAFNKFVWPLIAYQASSDCPRRGSWDLSSGFWDEASVTCPCRGVHSRVSLWTCSCCNPKLMGHSPTFNITQHNYMYSNNLHYIQFWYPSSHLQHLTPLVGPLLPGPDDTYPLPPGPDPWGSTTWTWCDSSSSKRSWSLVIHSSSGGPTKPLRRGLHGLWHVGEWYPVGPPAGVLTGLLSVSIRRWCWDGFRPYAQLWRQ